MKTYFLAEESGNILTLSGAEDPNWFSSNQGFWMGSVGEAVEARRSFLALGVRQAEEKVGEARRRLAAFEEGCRNSQCFEFVPTEPEDRPWSRDLKGVVDELNRQEGLLRRALAIIAGMPVTEEVAAVRNEIVRGANGSRA